MTFLSAPINLISSILMLKIVIHEINWTIGNGPWKLVYGKIFNLMIILNFVKHMTRMKQFSGYVMRNIFTKFTCRYIKIRRNLDSKYDTLLVESRAHFSRVLKCTEWNSVFSESQKNKISHQRGHLSNLFIALRLNRHLQI